MASKEILIELLKQTFADRLSYIEKRSQEQIDSLMFTKKEFDAHGKKIASIVKMKNEKDQKDREEAEKKEKEKVMKLEKSEKDKTEKKRDKSSGPKDKENGRKSLPAAAGMKASPSMANFSSRKTIGNNTERRGTITSLNTTANKRTNTPGRKTTTNMNQDTNKKSGRASSKPGLHKSSTTAQLNNKNPFDSSNKGNNPNGKQISTKAPPKEEPKKMTFLDIHKEEVFHVLLSYLSNHEKISLFSTSKKLFLSDLISLIADYQSKLHDINNVLYGQTIDDKIKEITETKTNDSPIEEFTLNKGAAKAIDIMKDPVYYSIFKHSIDKNKLKKIIIIYRIFCQLLLKEDLVAMTNQEDFWKEMSSYVMNSGYKKLNEFIKNEVELFDFDIKNIIKIRRLVGNDPNMIIPTNFSKICPTTGLLAFAIKDAFEYCGLLQSNKTHPEMMMKNLEYQKELIDKVTEYQVKLQAISDKN